MTERRTKVAFIGAGSTVFARVLMQDLLQLTDIDPLEIRLMDIDGDRLAVTAKLAELLVEQIQGAGSSSAGERATIVATTDRRRALAGADYVVCLVQIGGYRPATLADFEIPKRYGLQQTIADTLGIGGIMRGLRTIPFLQSLAADMKELCPDAWLFNYANPMAMNQWAVEDIGIRTVGLCHGIRRTARQLAGHLGIPFDELAYTAAGINHMAFFLHLSRRGEDVYPRLRRLAKSGRWPREDGVRFEMLAHFGYFVSESSFHFAEYVPYFLRSDRPDLVERHAIPVDEYLRRCEQYERRHGCLVEALAAADVGPDSHPLLKADVENKSDEDLADIIHSLETGEPRRLHANVRNRGYIDNLPEDAVVELPCFVDGFGVHPLKVGPLPSHLAALMHTNVNVQRLTVEAATTGDRETVYRAAMLDPRTAATLTLDEIRNLVDELMEAHAPWLPQFAAQATG